MHNDATPGSDPSDTARFSDLAAARLSRRGVLGGGAAAGLAALLAACTPTAPGGPATTVSTTVPPTSIPGIGLLGFTGIDISTADQIVVPDGYVAQVIAPWGQPIRSNGPAYRPDGTNTAAEQAQQVGMHHDGMHFFPLESGSAGSREGLLVFNNEYVDQTLLYSDGNLPLTQEKVDKAVAAHGVTILRVELREGEWKVVDSQYNRRITGTTPMAFSGPVAESHPKMQANNPPRGTLNNCANGFTPWGTYLTCEENWNGYFGTADTSYAIPPEHARYGVSRAGWYGWHNVDARFDIAVNANEMNHFGWIVEIDPFDPDSTPVKRTALGRIKHENAAYAETAGRAVVYTGDDENGDYVYKFVSSGRWRTMRSRGQSPFDHGTLYVARFHEDGSGRWLPLVAGTGPLTEANGWADQADVLLRTRQAADAVGATRMDRPEWITVHPETGEVYATMTNGSTGPSPANPRNPNPYGHIVRWRETGGDHRATTFEWDVWVLAGDPAYDPAVTIDGDIYGSPDGIYFDPDGRLWIQTDISNSSQLRADRGYDNIGNNQMLAVDPATGETRRFLVGPKGCEITGIAMTPDQRTMFVNVQHPGESTSAIGTPTAENPRLVSNWPDFDPTGRPRPATVVVRRVDGGVIGT